jgi:hypothetical protein
VDFFHTGVRRRKYKLGQTKHSGYTGGLETFLRENLLLTEFIKVGYITKEFDTDFRLW